MPKSVLTLGTFDGVHRGHQALIRKVVQRARAIHATPVVLAFDMPPRHAGEAARKPVLLTTLPEKLRLLKQYGIRKVDVLRFTRRLASTRPEDFFMKTMLRHHGAREIVVGPRVAFGRHRAGRLPLLLEMGKKYHVRVHVVPSITRAEGTVSSRRIRKLLAGGHLEKANALLGYPYSIEGRVVHGDGRGKRLGFPTANIGVSPAKILPRGVYWVKVYPGAVDGLCNVGTRPTFKDASHELHCEVFLWYRKASLYGRQLRIDFLRKIRNEKRFSSPEALKRQIGRDIAKAQLYRKSHFSI